MESLEILLDDVYRKGLGVSRRHVLARAGYRDFELDFEPAEGDSTYLREFSYLGGRLADRAFQNMPYAFRQDALDWQLMTVEDQETVLKSMIEKLTSVNWYQKRPHENYNTKDWNIPSKNGIFPAITKSWQRGPVQPNCLGMTQVLVGFARAAGVESMVLTPLVSSWYSAYVSEVKDLQLLSKQIKATFPDEPYVRKWLRFIHRLRVEILKSMDLRHKEMTHHAVVIWMADGTSRIVDPYMGIYDTAPESEDILLATWMSDPHKRVTRGFSFEAVDRSITRAAKGHKKKLAIDEVVYPVIDGLEPPRTKKQWRTAYERVITEAIWRIESYARIRMEMAPVYYELAHAELSLAAFTINHWSIVKGVDGSSSVSVFATQPTMRDQLPYLRSNPDFYDWMKNYASLVPVLPELRQYLKTKKKERI